MNRRNPENLVTKTTLLLTSTLIVMVTGAMVSALPAVQAHFGDVPNVAFWVCLMLTGPSLFIAAVAPIAGYVVDSIGRKLVLVISTLVYRISGLAGYLAPTLTWLLISRAALGIFVSPIIGQPLVAALGFRALCLGVGVLLLTMAAFFGWRATNCALWLTGRHWSCAAPTQT